MERTKIILDTDIGDDIDDALALALILNSPELELLGVTTCFNNAKAKARIARRLLDLAGRGNIPVHAGADAPLLSRQDHSEPPRQYEEALKDIQVEENAVEYLYETLRASREKLTLLAIGPLTNLGLLFCEHPDIKGKIERIVLMGGCYYSNQREWNILCDAESADIVFRSGVPLVGVGLDVTLQCVLPPEKIAKIQEADSPVCRYLSRLISLWGGKKMFLHDPLAVLAIFSPSLLTMYPEQVEVETKGTCCQGMTFNHSLHQRHWEIEPHESNILACRDVEADKAVDLFLERILK